IIGLAVSTTIGTVIESLYDTPTAVYYIYNAWWFYGLLGLLATLIFCVAVSRWPWKPRHIPFLLAHAGILILLMGGYLTKFQGIDGNMTITEGDTHGCVELDQPVLYINESMGQRMVHVPWQPPGLEFKPIDVPESDIHVTKFLPHADPVYAFIPA